MKDETIALGIIVSSFATGAYSGYCSGKGIPVTGLENFALIYAPIGLSAAVMGMKIENQNSSGLLPGMGMLTGGAAGGLISLISSGAGYLAGYSVGGLLK